MNAIKTQSAASLNMTTLLFSLVIEKSFVATLDCVAGFARDEFARVAAGEPAFDLDTFDPVAALMNFAAAALSPERAEVVAEATVGLDFVVGQMTAARDEAAAKAADWAAREYKKNTKKVQVGDPDRIGDYPWARPSTTLEIGYINENRRSIKVEGYVADVAELDGFLAIAADMKTEIERGYFGDADVEAHFAAARKVHDTRSGW